MYMLVSLQCRVTILGRVLNRFSKDIGFMDNLLPLQFVELFTVSVIVWMVPVVIAVYYIPFSCC